MTTPERNWVDTATEAALASAISDSADSFSLKSGQGAGYPTSAFVATIDRGDAKEERVLVGTRASDFLSDVTRGYGGTTPIDHDANSKFEHTISGAEMQALFDHARDLSGDDHAQYLKSDLVVFSREGALAVATGASRLRFPQAATIEGISAAVGTAPVGAAVILDVNINGVTAFTTQANRPTIAAGANNEGGEVTNMDNTAIAAGDYLTVDIDQVGSTTLGADLTVTIRYKRA